MALAISYIGDFYLYTCIASFDSKCTQNIWTESYNAVHTLVTIVFSGEAKFVGIKLYH